MNSILKKVQRAELYLLLELDKVCRQSGLIYFLDSGTALGAVRHGGFIPWDDDIDVGMPRRDYERLMEIGQSLFPSNIVLQNKKTDNYYKRNAAKLRIIGTVFPENNDLSYKYNGIFIDIFPFDNIPGNALLARLNVKIIVESLHIVRSYRNRNDIESPSWIRRLFSHFIRIMPKSWIDRLEAHSLKVAIKNKDSFTGRMTCYFWRMSQSKQYLFNTDQILPVKDIFFEGHRVMIMRNPDYYLSLMYGNYMELPPESKRVSHLKGDVDFGDFVLNY